MPPLSHLQQEESKSKNVHHFSYLSGTGIHTRSPSPRYSISKALYVLEKSQPLRRHYHFRSTHTTLLLTQVLISTYTRHYQVRDKSRGHPRYQASPQISEGTGRGTPAPHRARTSQSTNPWN